MVVVVVVVDCKLFLTEIQNATHVKHENCESRSGKEMVFVVVFAMVLEVVVVMVVCVCKL